MSDNIGNSELSKRKRAELESRLAQGLVQVRLNSTVEGISTRFLMDRVQVTLNLSYAFRAKIFEIDEQGVRVTLSFSGQPFLCVLPWESFYFMQSLDQKREPSGRPELFIESIPEPVLAHYGLSMHIAEDEEEEELPLTRPIFMDGFDDPEEVHHVLSELKDWAQSLEKIDTKNRDHKWPFPLEVIYDVVEGLEAQRFFKDDDDEDADEDDDDESFDTADRYLAKIKENKEGEHTPEKGIISLIRFQQEKQEVKAKQDENQASESTLHHGQVSDHLKSDLDED